MQNALDLQKVEREDERIRCPVNTRGCSSAGRAPALQAGGQEFDPPHLHQRASEDGNCDLAPKPNGLVAQVVRAYA